MVISIDSVGSDDEGSIHNDTKHSGSAKRNAANGVAGINADSKVPDNLLEKPVGTHEADTSTHGVTTIADAADLTTHEADTSTHGVTTIADAADLTTHEADTSTHGVATIADAADLTTHEADTSTHGVTTVCDDVDLQTHINNGAVHGGGGGSIGSDTYTGNNGISRAIAHGLGVTPKFVFITTNSSKESCWLLSTGYIHSVYYQGTYYTIDDMDDTNFYVGNINTTHYAGNAEGKVYTWIAIG